MKKGTITGLAVATAIVITVIFLHLYLLTICFRYNTQKKETKMGNANVISFSTGDWITLSRRMPLIEADIITAWIFEIVPAEPQYEESRQYLISKICVEAFSETEGKWLLLSEDIAPKQFQHQIPEWPSKPYYIVEANVPARLLSYRIIRIKLVIVSKDATNHTEIEKEVDFIHDIKMTKKYSNLIMDIMSGV